MDCLRIRMIDSDSNDYPYLLKKIYDVPKTLYVRGDMDISNSRNIAVIGSRKPSYYGEEVTKYLTKGLAQAGYVIVSGMARGIDTFAHLGAMEGGGKTIAVLGSGVDVIYPKSNINVANDIMKNGVIISELPLGSMPLKFHFPMRNRIISGMSLGVVVVEASDKSGTLITVDCALEQGREVFAVPGPINSIESYGPNKLIKEGAKIVTKVQDIIDELQGGLQMSLDLDCLIKKHDVSLLNESEKIVFNVISKTPIHVDSIQSRVNIDFSELNSSLVLLETKGFIKHLAGNFFVKM